MGNVIYIQTTGPTQLSYRGEELPGHGFDYHTQGYGTPIGKLQHLERCLSSYTLEELAAHAIHTDRKVQLVFRSGTTVVGRLNSVLRRDHKNLVFQLSECTVTGLDGETLFKPEWGHFDMAVGESVE